MSQDLNSSDIDSVSLTNLAFETSAIAANANFQNLDIVLRAIAYFMEAIEIDPRNYRAYLGLGIILIGGQMYDEAIKYLESAYDLNPNEDIDKYINLAEEFRESQRSLKVEAVLNKKKSTVSDLVDLGNKFKFK